MKEDQVEYYNYIMEHIKPGRQEEAQTLLGVEILNSSTELQRIGAAPYFRKVMVLLEGGWNQELMDKVSNYIMSFIPRRE